MNTDMISYYRDRAAEYEKIYSKPERQDDLLTASEMLQDIFSGKEVSEIACGTGYWTERISKTAVSIFATDINKTVIEIARSKNYVSKINFDTADIFDLKDSTEHESLFAGFIWSHIKTEELDNFISITNSLVKPGGTIVFMDNNYVEGSNLPITDTDATGNTYQTRKLDNGTTHKVLKNFPTENFIRQLLKGKATDINFRNLQYYWILEYKTMAIDN